ncbi:MAG: hypothetical protein ABH871_07670 [Pseudomonadota bacterium]
MIICYIYNILFLWVKKYNRCPKIIRYAYVSTWYIHQSPEEIMKQFKKIILFILPLFLCGCLEVKQEITVNKDGGGQIIETVMMSKSALKELNDFFSSFPAEKGQKTKKIDIYDKKKLEADAAQYGPDVKYVSSKMMNTKTKEGYEVVYAFSDINNLRINQNPGDKGPKTSKDAKSDTKQENITFKFEKGDPSTLIVSFPAPTKSSKEKKQKADKKDKEAEQKELDELREIFKDLYIGITIQTEGEIVETNATYRDGNKITVLEMDFGKLLEDQKNFESFAKKEPQTVEEAKEMLKNLAGFKVELNNKIVAKFR